MDMAKYLSLLFLVLYGCTENKPVQTIAIGPAINEWEAHPENEGKILQQVGRLEAAGMLSANDKLWYYQRVADTIKDDTKKIGFINNCIAHIPQPADSLLLNYPVLLNNLSISLVNTQQYSEAVATSLKAVEYSLALAKHYPAAQSKLEFAYYNLALAYRYSNNFFLYKKYLNLSLAAATSEESKAFVYQNFSDYCLNAGNDSSYYYSKLAYGIFSGMGNKISALECAINLANYFFTKGKYDSAQVYAEETCQGLKKMGYKIFSTDYTLLGNAYLKLHNAPKAILNLEVARQYATTYEEKLGVYKALRDYYRVQGNTAAAYRYLDSAEKYSGLYYNFNLAEKTKELENNFNLRQKDASISTLKLENQVEAEKNKLKSILLLALSVVAAIVIYVISLFNKNTKFKTEHNKNLLEQKLFASQMSPHFIFNALSAIQAEILSNNNKEANTYLARFGQNLQAVLKNTTLDAVSISSEYNNLINYISLQQMRYRNFEFATEVYEGIEADEDEIPPMLLQPLVENAIEHGLKTVQGGVLHLSIMKTKRQLLCRITDNGAGLGKSSAGNNLSTTLIKKRLQFLARQTRQELSLTIKNSEQGNGVASIITIPYTSKY